VQGRLGHVVGVKMGTVLISEHELPAMLSHFEKTYSESLPSWKTSSLQKIMETNIAPRNHMSSE